MDIEKAREIIVDFIRTRTQEAGVSGAVVGISGGVDSALVAYLAVEALGNENVLGVHLPELNVTSPEDVLDATEIAGRLGIEFKTIDISEVLTSFMHAIPDSNQASPLTNGNLKARIRMSILYYYANLLDRMVIGTGNNTEIMLGYYTKYGDGGVDIEPIGDLYKTEVFELARFVGVPEGIVTKAPSAGLWVGQTDEEELGISYVVVDKLIRLLLEENTPESIRNILGISEEQVASVIRRINSNIHKHQVPPVAVLKDARMF